MLKFLNQNRKIQSKHEEKIFSILLPLNQIDEAMNEIPLAIRAGAVHFHANIDCISGDQTKNSNLFLLTDSMNPFDRLKVALQIPFRIVHNDRIGCD